jgi:hypothetical protein
MKFLVYDYYFVIFIHRRIPYMDIGYEEIEIRIINQRR